MGLLNKLMFWRKDEEYDFDTLAEKELGSNPPLTPKPWEEDHPFGQPRSFDRPLSPSSPLPGTARSDLDLVNSKLDTLKAQLSVIDQRLATIERSLSGEQKSNKLW